MNKNPMFTNIQTGESTYDNVDKASYKGVSIKTGFLLLISIIIASFVAFYLPAILEYNPTTFIGALLVTTIVGFIAVIVGRISDRAAKYCSVVYAVCEGLFLGFISTICEAIVPGVVTIALFSTLAIFAVVLILFATGVIKISSKVRSFAIVFVLGALVLMLLNGILYATQAYDYENYLTVILIIEIVLLVYGAFALSVNFAEASYVVNAGATKNAEWSVALGLMVTLIYIYIQLLRIAVIIASKRR